MYQLVAIDLDETLYNDKHEVCIRNLQAIQKAKALGVKIVPCSGRTPGLLKDLYSTLGIDNDDEYSILGNGSIVISNGTEEVLHCEPLSFKKAKELFEWGKQHDIPVELYTAKKAFFFNVDEQEKALAKFVGNIDVLKYEDFSNVEGLEILKVIYLVREEERRVEVATLLQEVCEGEVTISFSSDRYVELNRHGIHKGLGLEALAKHLGIPIEETMAIGDNSNDLDLLKTAGLSIAMQNAIPALKDIADYVCESDNNQGGVGEAIEKFIL